ncbi:MAG: aspartate/glutamate racemase family protein [Myxococcota bacterium]
MGTRIHAQSIYTLDHPGYSPEGYAQINRGIQRIYERVLHADTTIEACFVPRSTFYTSHAYLEMLNNGEIVRGIIDAETKGYDVAFVRCGNDPGIREARESVSMPVVAMTESAMHLACQLGARFAVIAVDDKSIPLVERNLRLYGLEREAIATRPVRKPRAAGWDECVVEGPKWFESVDYVRERVIPAFDACARELIDDGAEIIVTGCALFGALTLADHRKVEGTDVPILESVAVGVKAAEMQGDLYRSIGLSTSKHLTYRSLLTAELRDQLAGPFLRGDERADDVATGTSVRAAS